MGIASLSTLFLTPYAGYLIDKYGKKTFLLFGYILLVVSTFPLALLERVDYLYYVIRIVHGCSFSLFFVSAGALVVDLTSEEKRAQALGIYGVFTIINYAVAPYVGSFLTERFGFDFLMFFLTATAVLGFCLSLFISDRSGSAVKEEADGSGYLDCLRNRPAFISAVTLFVCGGAFMATFNFISVFSLSIDIKNFQIYFLFYAVSVLGIRLFLGWVPDKYGKWRVASPFVFLLGLSVFLLSLVEGVRLMAVCAVMFGCAHGFVYPSIYSIIIDSSPEESRSRAFAISSVSFTGGGMVWSFVFGVVAEVFGFRVMFASMGLLVFLGFLIFAKNRTSVESAL